MEGVIKTHKPLQYFFSAMCAMTVNVFLRVKEVLKTFEKTTTKQYRTFIAVIKHKKNMQT